MACSMSQRYEVNDNPDDDRGAIHLSVIGNRERQFNARNSLGVDLFYSKVLGCCEF